LTTRSYLGKDELGLAYKDLGLTAFGGGCIGSVRSDPAPQLLTYENNNPLSSMYCISEIFTLAAILPHIGKCHMAALQQMIKQQVVNLEIS